MKPFKLAGRPASNQKIHHIYNKIKEWRLIISMEMHKGRKFFLGFIIIERLFNIRL